MSAQLTIPRDTEAIEDSYPLSPVQQGMVFHHLLYPPQSGVDIQQMVGTLREDLNVRAFLQAWQRVVERHPILRTSFRWHGLDEPVQEVHRQVVLSLAQQNWCGVSPQERQERLHAYLCADRRRGFDITTAPLMRLALFRADAADYDFVWTFHHLLLDGRSFFVVVQEFFSFYEALCQGQDLQVPLPPPPHAYIDWLRQQDPSKAEGFWRQTLAGFSAPTPLLIDHAADNTLGPSEGRGEQGTQFSATITSALQALAKEQQVTLYTLVQGAWALLLSRYSSAEDIVFGTTHLCRWGTVKGAESMVGMFMNTLPVRVRVSFQMPLGAWLKKLRAEQLAVRGYEHTPLIKVQEWSDVPRGTVLFDTILVFENFRWTSSLRERGSGWKNRELRILEQPNYALTVFGSVDTDLFLTLTYDRRRFADATITRMLGHFRTLLESMAANPQQRLADLQLLTPAERHQIVVEWNQTKATYPREACLHQLIEVQAERTPDAVAVVCGNQHLTYRELNIRANQLAYVLRKQGVGPEVLVGICTERSVEMVVGVLGILKAGGAYVPLDPSYPKERLAFMLEDAQVPVLVTQQRLSERLPVHKAQVVCLDPDWQTIVGESVVATSVALAAWNETIVATTSQRHQRDRTGENPDRGATAENVAYVIYTSGSIGKPKGVQIPHRAVVDFLYAMRQQVGVTERDVFLAITTLSFDIAALELFLPLTVGARVEVATRAEAADGRLLAEKLGHTGATVMQATPATWRMLLDTGWAGSPQLKILCGGEALPRDLANELLVRGAALWNLYGPTETTIWSAAAKIESTAGPVSIGRPIANTQIYLLDRYLQPVPVGVPGEVHIGGDGLARGYLNRPELTAERFIPHPFSSELGARLYQTGDLARYLPDGTIECCGRIDHQVKIRGFRLEPGEIEAVLGQHVQEAVVLAREDIAGDKRLVAYVVPRQKPAASVQELRDALKAQLPDYMIPSAFVFLPSLPLTPNGKVDRRALPAPAQSTVEQERVIVAPRDELEHQLLQIWQDIFRRDALSVQDNFFELGGHSLLAVRMLAKIQQRLGKRLPLATLLQEATIAHLARLLRQQERPMPRSFVVAIQPHGTQPPFFCVHPASGHVYQYRELARLLGPDQPFYGIASPAVEKKGEIDLTIEAMAARYLEQIRLVQPKGPYFLGGYCMGGLIVFEIARLLHTQGQHVALLALVNTWGPASQLPFLPTLKKRLLDFLRRERQEQTVSLHKKQQRFRRTLLEFLLPALRDRELWRLQSLEKLNERIARAYVPQVYAGTLVFFRVQKQPAGIVPNPEREWVKLAAAGAEVYEIPGDHYSMFDSPNVPVLAACLRGCLQKAQQNCGLRIKFSAEQ